MLAGDWAVENSKGYGISPVSNAASMLTLVIAILMRRNLLDTARDFKVEQWITLEETSPPRR